MGRFRAGLYREKKAEIKSFSRHISGVSSQCKTVSDMCSAVWNQVINAKSQNTIYGYNAALKRIDTTMGTLGLLKLTPRTIQAWIDDLSLSLSPKTVKDTYSILRLCCSIAVNWELLKSNPCHDVILPSNKKKKSRYFHRKTSPFSVPTSTKYHLTKGSASNLRFSARSGGGR